MPIKKHSSVNKHTQEHERKRSRDLSGLISSLQDQDAQARRWAAHDLAELPPTELEAAAKALLAQLQHEQLMDVRQAIFTSLTRIGGNAVAQGLIAYLRSEDAELRNEAVEALKQLPDEVAPIIEPLLHASEPDLRIFAVNILESLRHPNVENWLLDVINHDDHVNVCATAVDLLGEVATRQAKPSLIALRQRFINEPYICFAVDIALRRLGEE